jgi:phage/plasmid-associated DNA primase
MSFSKVNKYKSKLTNRSNDTDDEDKNTFDSNEEVNPIESDVLYKLQSTENNELRKMKNFLSDPKMIMPKSDPNTNIIDRQEGKCYNIPDKKIPEFFKLLNACRLANIRTMFLEKQQDYSGIMLDFDIYQDCEKSQLTNKIIGLLCNQIMKILVKLINISNVSVIHIGITRRPVVTYNESKECYKDGFHLLIPSIKIQRSVKKLLIKKIIESDLLEKYMQNVIPAKIKGVECSRNDFLDQNSSHVPTFFIGSSTKKGSNPYKLTDIYEVNIQDDDINCSPELELLNNNQINICYEFSINYEHKSGLIKKQNYEILDKYINEVFELSKTPKNVEESNNIYGMIAMNSINDAQLIEIEELLDTLSVERSNDYQSWLNVMFALANASPSYKMLAENFSRKSKKFDICSFEQTWNSILKGPRKDSKAITLGSIHYWAKIDNPERYEQLRKKTVYNIMYSMANENYKEGILSHADLAEVVSKLLRYKYVTDIPKDERKRVWYEFIIDGDKHVEGELYKWRKCSKESPVSLTNYISDKLPKLCALVLQNLKKNYENSSEYSKFYQKTLNNFKQTMRSLGNLLTIKNIILMAEAKFDQCGFDDALDKNPVIRGVANGILKLSCNGSSPELIQGYHSYPVSKFTDVPYIPFNPYDPQTKKILITLRSMFPNKESDSFEFTMMFLASTLDGNPKESMFMIMVGQGSNGKSFLVELHKSAIGSNYGVKMPLNFLTTKSTSADNATPTIMQLKDATFAYYSESDKNEVLNASRMKEITGQETLAGRKLHQDMINFKPKAHHLVTSNNDFDINSHDHGTWRRLIYNPLKIRFVDTSSEVIDYNNPFHREADLSISDNWTSDSEVRGRYLGFMVWMHYWLYRKYQGKVKKVPHHHIKYETEKYKSRQDLVTRFMSQQLVKTADNKEQVLLSDEISKYVNWHIKIQGVTINPKGLNEVFLNSMIGKHILNTKRGYVLVGHRFLDVNETKNDDEEYYNKEVFELEITEENLNIISESPEEYYQRVCVEYDKYKYLFDTNAKYNVDTELNIELPEEPPKLTHNGRFLPAGVILKPLEEAHIKSNTNLEYQSLNGFLPINEDSDFDE